MRNWPRLLVYQLILVLLSLLFVLPGGGAADAEYQGPSLSSTALLSRFAREQGLARISPSETALRAPGPDNPVPGSNLSAASAVSDIRVNQDYSLAPQVETTIAINPSSQNMLVAGATDYRLGVPIGAAFYASFDGGGSWSEGFPPFPLLVAYNSAHEELVEAPFGTGDPVVAFGAARAGTPGLNARSPVVYYAYLGVSSQFCEHGIFVSRSTNGLTWTRPVVPRQDSPSSLFTPVYWDSADDCDVFNDKPWMAVDTSGGPHAGRVYVVWSRFVFSDSIYQESSIRMVYSDDNGATWSDDMEINGSSPTLCPFQVGGGPRVREPDAAEPPGPCNQSQFSTVVVGPDGTLHVAFLNQQSVGEGDGFRNQYLVVSVDPGTLDVEGPYLAALMIDGKDDFPVNGIGLPTLCNSNFRLNTAGNLAIDPSDPSGKTLYLVFVDNRNGSSFPSRPEVTQDPPDSFSCPDGSTTDADVFIMRSTDGGVTWVNPATGRPPPLRVNQDGLRNGKDQWFPFVAVSASARVDVVFYDRRDDPFNRSARVYLARSSDRGATWTETRVSSAASNMNWAFEGGLFMGDYNGLAIAADGTSYPFWTDARNGTSNVRQSDVYMGRVAPETGGPTATPTPAPSATPSPTPTGPAVPWGDVDCSGTLGIGDAQKIVRKAINLAVSPGLNCPEIGSPVTVGGDDVLWGDVDCNGVVAIGDAQKVARSLIELPVANNPLCPAIGIPG